MYRPHYSRKRSRSYKPRARAYRRIGSLYRNRRRRRITGTGDYSTFRDKYLNFGGAIAGAGGSALGSALGSAIPIVGPITGALGGVLGGMAGKAFHSITGILVHSF